MVVKPERRPPPKPSLAAVEAIAAGVAHEVRNPLNALRINLAILEQEISELVPDRGAHVFEVTATIARELRSLDDFVSEFLRYARSPRLRPEPVDVRRLLADLATFIGPECTRKGVSLSLAAGRGPRRVFADGTLLKHALLNLVLNALQATAAGGWIRIATATAGAGLRIDVTDGGEGLEADVLPRVFDAFYTTREGGTGLGLPIARRIAQAHGGAVTLHSRPGRGTTARLELPVRKAPGRGARRPAAAAPHGTGR
jgi:signal transduction histidine kinase